MRRALLLATLFVCGCPQQMAESPRYKPYEATTFFPDGRSARPLIEGTVARGQLRADDHLYRGSVGGQLATTFPYPVTKEVLKRGHERFDIYCSPCHDRLGQGEGMIVRRGFKRPPSFHIDRLREAPPGYFFDVMTRGFGVMSDYAAQVPVNDRWAIAAYIRALQLSQHALLADLRPEERGRLEALPR